MRDGLRIAHGARAVALPTAGEGQRSSQDRELVRRLAAGEESALAELYDRFAATLLALARRVLGDGGDAEEVVQEVFLHAWSRALSYDPARSSVSTWLVLLVRSRAIDRLRTRNVGDRAYERVRHQWPTQENPSGVKSVQDGERRQRVRAELASLPAPQRRVLELAYYGGLTQREIAAATGIPLGTVKTRTLLAMQKLRAALESDLRALL